MGIYTKSFVKKKISYHGNKVLCSVVREGMSVVETTHHKMLVVGVKLEVRF